MRVRRPMTLRDRVLDAVVDALHSVMSGAVGAAVIGAVVLGAVADHLAAAVRAARRHGMDRAFERVERAGLVTLGDGKGLVVIVAAYVASGHRRAPRMGPRNSCAHRGNTR